MSARRPFDGELTRLWGMPLTTSEIGALLGVSKNTVIGRAHRLRLPSRGNPVGKTRAERPRLSTEEMIEKLEAKRRKHNAQTAAYRLRRKAEALGVTVDGLPLPVSRPPREIIISRVQTCQAPLWGRDEKQGAFCGKPAVLGKSYCPDCCARLLVKPMTPAELEAARAAAPGETVSVER